jgi:hypothetical protein
VYFCGAGCKAKFDADPRAYAGSGAHAIGAHAHGGEAG